MPYLTVNNYSGDCTATLTVTDSSGVTDTCEASVSFLDTTPPAITCPDDVSVLSTSPSGAVVTFSPTASDNCDDAPDILCTPDSGDLFPIGTTFVSCTATDYSGNTHVCGFSVDVTLRQAIDIKPQSCPNSFNVNSRGLVPVAILGTEDFDVNDIDPDSIQLEGVSPVRWEWEDVATPYNGVSIDDTFDCTDEGPDGYMDFTLLFDRQAIVGAIGEVGDGDVLELTLTAELWDGTPFEGRDLVLIQKNK